MIERGTTIVACVGLCHSLVLCMLLNDQSASPDIKSYELHYTSKHPKTTFDREAMVRKAEALRDSQQDHSANGSHHKKK